MVSVEALTAIKIVLYPTEVTRLISNQSALRCLQQALMPLDVLEVGRQGELRGFAYVALINKIIMRPHQMELGDIRTEILRQKWPSIVLLNHIITWECQHDQSDINGQENRRTNNNLKIITYLNCNPGISIGLGICNHWVVREVHDQSVSAVIGIPCLIHVSKINEHACSMDKVEKFNNNQKDDDDHKNRTCTLHLVPWYHRKFMSKQHLKSLAKRRMCVLLNSHPGTCYGFNLGYLSSGQHIVERVDIGKHADRCGLRTGDILISINGHDTNDMKHCDLVYIIKTAMSRNYPLYLLLESNKSEIHSIKDVNQPKSLQQNIKSSTTNSSYSEEHLFGFYKKLGFDICSNIFNQHFVSAIDNRNCFLTSLGLKSDDQIVSVNDEQTSNMSNEDLKRFILNNVNNKLALTVISNQNRSVFSNVYPVSSTRIVFLEIESCKCFNALRIRSDYLGNGRYRHFVDDQSCLCLAKDIHCGEVLCKLNDQNVEYMTNEQVMNLFRQKINDKTQKCKMELAAYGMYAVPFVELLQLPSARYKQPRKYSVGQCKCASAKDKKVETSNDLTNNKLLYDKKSHHKSLLDIKSSLPNGSIVYHFNNTFNNYNQKSNPLILTCRIKKDTEDDDRNSNDDIGLTFVSVNKKVIVKSLKRSKAFQRSGIREGDVLLSINKRSISKFKNCQEISCYIRKCLSDDKRVDICVARSMLTNGQLCDIKSKSAPDLHYTIESSDSEKMQSFITLLNQAPRKCTLRIKKDEPLGFTFDQCLNDYDCPIITHVTPASPAHRSGLHLYDLVLAINKISVQSMKSGWFVQCIHDANKNSTGETKLELLVMTKRAYAHYMKTQSILLDDDRDIFDYDNPPSICFNKFAPRLVIFRGKVVKKKIGISITEDQPRLIADTDRNSPARKAGICKNDVIHEINDVSVDQMPYPFISNLLLQAKRSGELKLLVTDQAANLFYQRKQVPLNSYLNFLSVLIVDK